MKKFMIPDINDGLRYKFDLSEPEHIRFKVRSNSETKESADLRLRRNDKSSSDVVFFAFNMNKHIKFNAEQKTFEYNAYEWVEVDILIDYGDDEVELYIDGDLEVTTAFYYEDAGSVDELLLYSLNEGIEVWWKDLEICDSRCSGSNLDFASLLTFTLAAVFLAN
jgi:hypothetical protein